MPASEYGSYYWCVVLTDAPPAGGSEIVYLHADAMNIDAAGNLRFTSAGRRPVGAEPSQTQNGGTAPRDHHEGQSSPQNGDKSKDEQDGEISAGMIYLAFAAGSWKAVYAAKLRDGSPACVEHWITQTNGQESGLPHAQRGAAGFSEMG